MEYHLMMTIMATFVYKMAKVQYVSFKGDPRSASIHPREDASETALRFVSCTILKVQKFPISTQRCTSESALKFIAKDIVVDSL